MFAAPFLSEGVAVQGFLRTGLQAEGAALQTLEFHHGVRFQFHFGEHGP
jgi:hypothetical protein